MTVECGENCLHNLPKRKVNSASRRKFGNRNVLNSILNSYAVAAGRAGTRCRNCLLLNSTAYGACPMRLISTPDSVAAKEVTVLALIETALAITISVAIAVHLGTVKWIVISASLAPLLLLQTEQSAARALHTVDRLWDNLSGWFDRRMEEALRRGGRPSFWSFLRGGLTWGLEFIAPIQARVEAAVIMAIRHPILTLSSIPGNWYKVTFCLDSHHVPEVVSGYETLGKRELFKLTEMMRFMRSRRLLIPLYVPFGLLLFLPPLLYRWSLKATSIVYTPLLWITHGTFRRMDNVRDELRKIRTNEISHVTICYSALVILLLAVKIAIMTLWAEFAVWLNSSALGRFSSIYVAPAELPIWQVASFVNASLAFGLFLFTDTVESWPDEYIERLLRLATFVRGILTCYTITCGVYITAEALEGLHLPRLGTKLFPWQ